MKYVPEPLSVRDILAPILHTNYSRYAVISMAAKLYPFNTGSNLSDFSEPP